MKEYCGKGTGFQEGQKWKPGISTDLGTLKKIRGYVGATSPKIEKGLTDIFRKPLKFLVELDRIELTAS